MFSTQRISALAPLCKPEIAAAIASALEPLAPLYGVTTALRVSHLMAQLAHESQGFTRLEENLNYTSDTRIALVWPRLASRAHELVRNPHALANAAYANRIGNGDEAAGDGWRFRGRGIIQLTGRDNYRKHGDEIGVDLIAEPQRAAEPAIAAQLALAFWRLRGCNACADNDDVEGVTRLINGPALRGLDRRRALTARAKEIFAEDARRSQ